MSAHGPEAVAAAFAAAGLAAAPRRFDAPVPTAADAAAALGCPVGAITNSLVFTVADEPVLLLASGAHRVDTRVLARHFGVGRRRVRRADPEQVLAATGQEVGGVAPAAHPAPLPTLIDAALAGYDVLWAGGGDHHAMIGTRFDDLVALTGGTVLDLAGP